MGGLADITDDRTVTWWMRCVTCVTCVTCHIWSRFVCHMETEISTQLIADNIYVTYLDKSQLNLAIFVSENSNNNKSSPNIHMKRSRRLKIKIYSQCVPQKKVRPRMDKSQYIIEQTVCSLRQGWKSPSKTLSTFFSKHSAKVKV